MSSLQALIGTLRPYLGKASYWKVQPNDSIKKSYGLVKLLRPIIASYESVTSGSEQFLLNIISPIRNICKFSVKSTAEFKEVFMKDRVKFDHNLHEVLSFDASSLYTSINVPRVISYILDIIYQDPETYFNETITN